ncbi:putative surface-exposed virulence protein BigA [Homarus americanus]|uniref:putative surface-exposed virulence protein BigA n=1 Tax=Homarus americanus TaxID=6706 RepID=UPI001C485AD9|nr:putative surface-exposed virulence protein BigA [Homarus americanus]XP_042236837.1 putative surface-exposed virulence protein BigA [Homarus americanus]
MKTYFWCSLLVVQAFVFMLLVVIFFFSHTPSTTTLPPIHIPLWQVQELLRYQGRPLKIGSSGQLEVLPDRPEGGTTSDDPKVIVDDEASDFVIKGGDVISPRDGEGGDVISPSDSKGGDMISPRDSGGGDVNTGHDDGNDANTVQGDEEVNTNIDHDNEEEQVISVYDNLGGDRSKYSTMKYWW